MKISGILPVKIYFFPREKIIKTRAWKKMGVKNPVKTVKSGREKPFLPVKKIKNVAKNGFHAQNDFHAKKKNTDLYWSKYNYK